MKWTFLFLLFGFASGPISSVVIVNGRISLLDISVVIFLIHAFFVGSFNYATTKKYLLTFGPFLILCCFSLIFAGFKIPLDEVIISSRYLFRFILYSLMLIPVWQAKRNDKQFYLKGLWLGGIIIAGVGIIQYFLYPNLRNLSYLGWDPHQYRVFSTLLDPNFTGIILVLTVILGVYLWKEKRIPNNQIILGNILGVVAFLLTFSRGAYVAFLASFSALLILHKRLQLLIVLVITFLVVLILLPKPGGEGVNLFRTMSIESRIENSSEAIDLFTKNPLIGVGFNTLPFTRFEDPQGTIPNTVAHSIGGFHNSFLFVLATGGIIGIITYLWIWKKLLEDFSPKTHWILFCSVLALFVHSIFDNSLFYPYVMIWMWILVGSFKESK